jgi:biofilm protein TabA
MIVADLSQIQQQTAMSPSLWKAVHFLQQAKGQTWSPGRVEIDGSLVYALVQSYQSRAEAGNPRFEAHRQYIDIQYVLSGAEWLGWAPLEKLTEATAYNAEKDVLHGVVPTAERTFIRLVGGQAAVLYPSDAHAPGLTMDISEPVIKIVVKVRLGAG